MKNNFRSHKEVEVIDCNFESVINLSLSFNQLLILLDAAEPIYVLTLL